MRNYARWFPQGQAAGGRQGLTAAASRAQSSDPLPWWAVQRRPLGSSFFEAPQASVMKDPCFGGGEPCMLTCGQEKMGKQLMC